MLERADLIYGAIAMMLINRLVDYITIIFDLFISLFIIRVEVRQTQYKDSNIDAIDSQIAANGLMSCSTGGPLPLPRSGIHLIYRPHLILALRSFYNTNGVMYSSYTMYMFSRDAERSIGVPTKTATGDNTILVTWIVTFAQGGRESTQDLVVRKTLPGISYPWQASAVKTICDRFVGITTANRALAVLIRGRTGIGKTSMGMFIANELISRKIHTQKVLMGFNLASAGSDPYHLPTDNTGCDTRMSVTIVVSDEYDVAVEMVGGMANQTRAPDQSDRVTGVASNKGALLNFLDALSMTKDLIFIATTNKAFGDFQEAFIREGRFGLLIDADEGGAVTTLGHVKKD